MKIAAFVMALSFSVLGWAQNPPATHDEPHQQHMQEMQQHMQAMRADIQKLTMSLNSIRASLPRINNLDERNRWEQTIEMWQVLINHMQQMAGAHEHRGHDHDAHDPAEHDQAPEPSPR